ncbi:MAG TPA: hypothetical protein VFJ81_00200 [Gemmatimonadales bacterium]|nr:hypothetical protein [Gemmatimonadales bacterium]
MPSRYAVVRSAVAMPARSALAGLGLLAAAGPSPGMPAAVGRLVAEDALARSYAAYAALTSYADSGTVVEQTSGFRDRYAFRTSFTRTPRNLMLDFHFVETEYNDGFKIKAPHKLVIWMENGNLQTWDSKSGEQQEYPEDGGHQVDALKSASYTTKGVSVLVPSLIYTKAGMASVIQATEEATAAGTETVGGRRCLKVLGIERWRYPSGQVTGVRPVTLWIDAETYLIRMVFEDTPRSAGRGVIERRTTTFEPTANPALEPSRFRYAVPEP